MFFNYFKIAIKVLTRRKFFTFVSLFGIAFTLMVLIVIAALFSHVDSNSRPESKGARCLQMMYMSLENTESNNYMRSTPGYKFLDRHIRNLEGVENYSIYSMMRSVTAYPEGQKLELTLKRTDGAFWEIHDFDFLEGSGLTRENEELGDHVAVINQSTRDRYFGGDEALGKNIEVDGQSFRVVGVVKNVPIYRLVPYSDVWVPLSSAASSNYRHQLIGNYAAVLLAGSRSQFPTIKKALSEELPKVVLDNPETFNHATAFADTRMEFVSRQLLSSTEESGGLGTFLGVLFGLMLLFMLLPAVNLINLNMSRIMERYSEIGVRKAFGATSRSLTGQFLVENLVLTLLGGLIGLLLAFFVLRLITATGLIPYADLSLNFSVFLYTMLFSIIFGLLSGVYPAWRMSRQHPVTALRGGVL